MGIVHATQQSPIIHELNTVHRFKKGATVFGVIHARYETVFDDIIVILETVRDVIQISMTCQVKHLISRKVKCVLSFALADEWK